MFNTKLIEDRKYMLVQQLIEDRLYFLYKVRSGYIPSSDLCEEIERLERMYDGLGDELVGISDDNKQIIIRLLEIVIADLDTGNSSVDEENIAEKFILNEYKLLLSDFNKV